MSIVLCLQYWARDAALAEEMAKFIADIEPTQRKDVRFRFVPRFDAPTPDMQTAHLVSKKFDVSWARTTKYQWDGWPAGPNGIAKEVLGSAHKWLRACGWEDADGILLLEPDCVPLSRTWLDQILAAWALARAEGKWVMGSWRNSGGPHGHINGCCVIDPEKAPTIAETITQHLAWDCCHSPLTRKHWAITGLVRNDFQSTHATEEILRTPETGQTPPVLVHGYKDTSALAIARKWLQQ